MQRTWELESSIVVTLGTLNKPFFLEYFFFKGMEMVKQEFLDSSNLKQPMKNGRVGYQGCMMFCMFYLMCSIQLLLRLCPRPYQWWRGWWGQWGKWGQCATATPAAAGASALRANTWAAGPNGASCTASQERSSENKIFFGHPEEGEREQEVLPHFLSAMP